MCNVISLDLECRRQSVFHRFDVASLWLPINMFLLIDLMIFSSLTSRLHEFKCRTRLSAIFHHINSEIARFNRVRNCFFSRSSYLWKFLQIPDLMSIMMFIKLHATSVVIFYLFESCSLIVVSVFSPLTYESSSSILLVLVKVCW